MDLASLSYQEVEELLESVIHNKKLAEINVRGEPRLVVFSHPSVEELLRGRYIYKQAYLEAKAAELPTKADVDKMFLIGGFVSEIDKGRIKQIEEKLIAQRKLLSITKIPGRRMPIEEVIHKLENDLSEIKGQNEKYYYLSCERKADEEVIFYLSWAGSYNPDGSSKLWSTYEDFKNETDIPFRNEIITAFSVFNRGSSSETIRFLARHNLWRIRFIAALKIGGSLFSRELSDLTPDQLALLYWSNYYQSIYEMLPDDQPDEATIKDDEALDKYMEGYFKKRETDRNESKLKKKGAGFQNKLEAWENSDELIITPSNPAYRDLQYTEERIQDKVKEGTDVSIHARSGNVLGHM